MFICSVLGVLESLRYILEYARDWYRAALWTYDYGLISWRLESGGLFRGFDRVYHDRIRCYSVLAFYVDCFIDCDDRFGKPEYLQEDVAVESPEEEKEAEKKEAPALLSFIRKPEMLLIQLGIVGLFALVVESAMFIGVDFTSNRYYKFLNPCRSVS